MFGQGSRRRNRRIGSLSHVSLATALSPFLHPVGSVPDPSVDEVLDLVQKGTLFTVGTDVVLLIRKPPVASGRANGNLVVIPLASSVRRPACVVPMLIRPWVLGACHADISFHLGVSRTLQKLERYSFIHLDNKPVGGYVDVWDVNHTKLPIKQSGGLRLQCLRLTGRVRLYPVIVSGPLLRRRGAALAFSVS